MQRNSAIREGIQRNKLLRYRAIAEEYQKWKELDVPTTVIYRKHIYPKFFISLRTLHNIIGTNINKELKELDANGEQLSLF